MRFYLNLRASHYYNIVRWLALFFVDPRQSQCYNHPGNENIDLLTYEQKGGQL
jgi:hypothetical protein